MSGYQGVVGSDAFASFFEDCANLCGLHRRGVVKEQESKRRQSIREESPIFGGVLAFFYADSQLVKSYRRDPELLGRVLARFAGNGLIAAKQGNGGVRVEQGCGHGKMERRWSVASGCAR